ncbi:endo-1,4-beta-xylanase xylA, putative (macronuclear) [Tetrahymena thermophila SB210]|uniref:Endo-1,4-beta-xylanase xylA, putative n=1 Tax=Tetrahymena thermophila (strain SB210) TaxID=312017 RepID=I7M4D0_TETTS|nr:endo-1,4-beta-xylanase xylA, putative [Tetrahymena thermophila SB210]EAS06244.1 endo-1,4-beta-xylanase xylA, putative [Tetrahymena thermophila SB210]|eukprot:XP_001026489.1 endo-1,4-beta-xylanase xylA, putative [Tetrahymena thermophila SB210]
MGSCAGKSQKSKNVKGSNQNEQDLKPHQQVGNEAMPAYISEIQKNEEKTNNQKIDSPNNQAQFNNKESTNQQEVAKIQEDKGVDITENKESYQVECQKMLNQAENQQDEEEKTEAVKCKNNIHNLDQQSTYFTSHLNELTSKKDCQSSETSTNNRPKRPTKVDTYQVGLVVQIFEPTQNSMEDVFSINEVDEEVEEDSQENLTDENEENIAQKNQHFQNLKEDNNQFKIFNTIQQRNPNDVLSSLSNSKLSHSEIQNEHLE